MHKHGLDTYVQADEIAVTGDNKTVYLADPVHRYDITDLRRFVIDNFVKLSGNNEISGGNLFSGVNSFDGKISAADDLSVEFNRLFDLRGGKSLAGLSCEISSEIENLSAALSGEIDVLSAKLSGEISARAMISVDEIPTNEFRFQHISREEYHDLVLSVDGKTTDPNTLYVISSDGMSMYGQKITDLLAGELSDDACTYGQLAEFKAQIKSAIDEALPDGVFENNLSAPLSVILKCLFDIKAALA